MAGEGLTLLRKSRARLAVGSLPALIAVVLAVVAAVTASPSLWVLAFLFALPGVPALAHVLGSSPKVVRRAGEVSAGADGVRVDGRLEVPRAELRTGFVVPYFGALPRVRLVRRGLRPSVELEAADLGAARAALERLGLDPTRTSLELDLPSPLAGRSWIIPVSFAVSVGMSLFLDGDVGSSLLLASLAAYVLLRALPGRLAIGLDGLSSRWLFWRRVHRYEDLTRVDPFQVASPKPASGLVLTRTDGSKHHVRVTYKGLDHSPTTAAYERISEAVDAYRRGARGHAGGELERGERSLAEWVAALKRVGHGAAATHRAAPVDPDRLLELVEDASARPVTRAAAAVALRATADDATRERVRVAAAASIMPSVRVALERASREETSDAGLEEALAEVEAEDTARPARASR